MVTSEGSAVMDSMIRDERDALKEENKKFLKEMERMKYRINHLVRSLSEEENKNAAQ
jgi:hypothetical protein